MSQHLPVLALAGLARPLSSTGKRRPQRFPIPTSSPETRCHSVRPGATHSAGQFRGTLVVARCSGPQILRGSWSDNITRRLV